MLDLVIRGGRILDGTGSPWFAGDVGIVGDRIVAVGEVAGRARREIDVDGQIVCPGFIDMHTHSDVQALANPAHEMKVHQGVTVDVIGQDGLGLAPVTPAVLADLRSMLKGWNGDPEGFAWDWTDAESYLDRFDGRTAINVVHLVGHGTLRLNVMGAEDRAPTGLELERMADLLGQGLAQGAAGLSTGLTYAPGMYATDDEVVALCGVMAGTGAFYCPHHRNYGSHAIRGYRDSIVIAERAGVPLHLAHCHLGFACNRGRASELLEMIGAARARGVDITLDTYPYLAGNTYLHAFLPGWALEGGVEATIARLRDPDLRSKIQHSLEVEGSDGHHGVPVDWETVIVEGVSIAERSRQTGAPPIDIYCDLCADSRLSLAVIHNVGNEENVRLIMTDAGHTGGSDGILVGATPHPRGWGTFPRFLATYVRDLGIISLESAVRRFTSLSARRLRLYDRGLIRPGMAADIVVFDPDGVQDRATYDEPRLLPDGIPHVVVNGVAVVDGGAHTGATPGRGLRSAR